MSCDAKCGQRGYSCCSIRCLLSLTISSFFSDLASSARNADFKLLEDLVREDSVHMHGLHPSLRSRRDTTDEEIAKLKKTSTKKPTQLIKQKPTSSQLKSSSLAAAAAATSVESTSARIESPDSGHISSPLSASTLASSSPADGNPFFAPEDVTLPPNSSSTVGAVLPFFSFQLLISFTCCCLHAFSSK